MFQRHYESLRGMGKLPVVGPLLTWAASRAAPRDSRVWMQVKSGPAEGIWLRLNPRTASGTISGTGERQELEIVRDHLRCWNDVLRCRREHRNFRDDGGADCRPRRAGGGV